MKRTQLKELIKELYLQEYSLNEEKKDTEEDTEEDKVEPTVDVETSDDVEDGEFDLSPQKKSIQDDLINALEVSKSMGDKKLVNQIGNTITYFTRTHILGEE